MARPKFFARNMADGPVASNSGAATSSASTGGAAPAAAPSANATSATPLAAAVISAPTGPAVATTGANAATTQAKSAEGPANQAIVEAARAHVSGAAVEGASANANMSMQLARAAESVITTQRSESYAGAGSTQAGVQASSAANLSVARAETSAAVDMSAGKTQAFGGASSEHSHTMVTKPSVSSEVAIVKEAASLPQLSTQEIKGVASLMEAPAKVPEVVLAIEKQPQAAKEVSLAKESLEIVRSSIALHRNDGPQEKEIALKESLAVIRQQAQNAIAQENTSVVDRAISPGPPSKNATEAALAPKAEKAQAEDEIKKQQGREKTPQNETQAGSLDPKLAQKSEAQAGKISNAEGASQQGREAPKEGAKTQAVETRAGEAAGAKVTATLQSPVAERAAQKDAMPAQQPKVEALPGKKTSLDGVSVNSPRDKDKGKGPEQDKAIKDKGGKGERAKDKQAADKGQQKKADGEKQETKGDEKKSNATGKEAQQKKEGGTQPTKEALKSKARGKGKAAAKTKAQKGEAQKAVVIKPVDANTLGLKDGQDVAIKDQNELAEAASKAAKEALKEVPGKEARAEGLIKSMARRIAGLIFGKTQEEDELNAGQQERIAKQARKKGLLGKIKEFLGVAEEPEKEETEEEKVNRVYSISGQVLDAQSGSGVAGVLIDGGHLGSQHTDFLGEYSFDNIAADSAYSITPSMQDCYFTPANASGVLTQHARHDFKMQGS